MASNYPPPYGYPETSGVDGFAGGVPPPPGYETVRLTPYPVTPDGRYGMPQSQYPQRPMIHHQQQAPMVVNVDVHRPAEYKQGKFNYFVDSASETPNSSQACFQYPQGSHTPHLLITPSAPLATICPSVPELSVTECDDEEACLLQDHQRSHGRPNRSEGRGQHEVDGSALLGTGPRDYRSITGRSQTNNRSNDGGTSGRDITPRLVKNAEKYSDGIRNIFFITFSCSFVVFVIGILAILFPPYLTFYFGIGELAVGLILMVLALLICQQNKREETGARVGAVVLAKIAGFLSVVLLLSCCVSVCADAVFLATCTQLPHEYICPEQWERLPINLDHALFRVISQVFALISAITMAATFYLQMHFLDKRHQLIPYLAPF